jgi:poly(3-hydroxyalkanoate) synthetase
VIDSDDILENPRASLSALCYALGINFDEAMLSWVAGPRAEDGVWAAHWYDSVHKSTGFSKPPSSTPDLGNEFSDILNIANGLYDQFNTIKIKV